MKLEKKINETTFSYILRAIYMNKLRPHIKRKDIAVCRPLYFKRKQSKV